MPEALRAWVQEHGALLGWLFTLSLGLFVLGLVLLPVMVVRLRPDALRAHVGDKPSHEEKPHPVRHALWLTLKNTVGVALALAGLAMLVLPGQGLLTLVVALALLDLPGKRRVERRLFRSRRVLGPANRLRQRFGRAPLLPPDPPRQGDLNRG